MVWYRVRILSYGPPLGASYDVLRNLDPYRFALLPVGFEVWASIWYMVHDGDIRIPGHVSVSTAHGLEYRPYLKSHNRFPLM